MITIRLLASNLQGELFEADADVVLNATFEQNITDLIHSLNLDFVVVLRIELPAHIFTDTPPFLIPSKDGVVTLGPRVPS